MAKLPSHSRVWIFLLVLFTCSILLNIILIRALYNGAKVAVVYDGDSFELADGRRVRLLGVDAPEKGRCGYEEAKEYLTKALLNRHVRFNSSLVDSFGRLVAKVTVIDGLFLFKTTGVNREMVAGGFAKNISGYDDVSDVAKSRGLGIYSAQCRSAVPKSNCTIKGNLQPEGKVYFRSTCPYYPQVVVDEAFGDLWLCSESQAVSLGFTLSKTCQ